MKTTTESLLRIAKQLRVWAIIFLFLGILLDTICFIGIMIALRDMDSLPALNTIVIGMLEIFTVTILLYLALNTASYYIKLKVSMAENIEKLIGKEGK